MSQDQKQPIYPTVSWKSLLRYFLWLGAFGFGGTIALCGYMQRDLVDRRRWFSAQDYLEGFAIAQLCPGPLSIKLAMYLGWLRGGPLGALGVGAVFIFPSFLLVLLVSILYCKWGAFPWIQGAFYGVGASVIALFVRSGFNLARITIDGDRVLFLICMMNAGMAILQIVPLVWVFIFSAVVFLFLRMPSAWFTKGKNQMLLGLPMSLTTGLDGPASSGTLLKILLYFSWAGTFIFGSGLAIIPFLHDGIVNQYHWLTERQFLDAVAVSMITPGPLVITVAFIGYLVAGFLGGVLAALGAFCPCYLFVIFLAPYYQRVKKIEAVKIFVSGITAAASGAILGEIYILGKEALIDIPTLVIFVVTLALILVAKKIPDPVWILLAGIVGVLIKTFV